VVKDVFLVNLFFVGSHISLAGMVDILPLQFTSSRRLGQGPPRPTDSTSASAVTGRFA